MEWIFSILQKALCDPKRDSIIFALACAIGWYVYNYSWDIKAQCALIFCVAWLLAAVVVCAWQWFSSQRRKIEEKDDVAKQKAFVLSQQQGQAQDVFDRLRDIERRTLCYAMLSGKKSSQYCNQFYYELNRYTSFINNLQEACTVPGTYDSLASLYSDNGKITLVISNTQLIDITNEYIRDNNIKKADIEKEIDAYIIESKKQLEQYKSARYGNK